MQPILEQGKFKDGHLLAAVRTPRTVAVFFTSQNNNSNMESTYDNTNAAEIHHFMREAFPSCKIASKYYPEDRAWRFQLSFTHKGTYSINPPMGCCMMNVQMLGREVTFRIVLFVEDFQSIHLQTVAN